MNRKLKILLALSCLGLVLGYNSCQSTGDFMRNMGTSTAGNPMTSLSIAPFTSSGQNEDLKVCIKRLKFERSDASFVSIDLNDVSERQVRPEGLALEAISVPIGYYSRLVLELADSCNTGRSLSVTNSQGSFASVDSTGLRFFGSITVSSATKKVSLNIQPFVDELSRVANNSELLTVAQSGSGGMASVQNWTSLSQTGAPSRRNAFTPIWTGQEMIVWGGYDDYNPLGSGARYNPVQDTWSALPTVNAPSARMDAAVVWTGQEMIVWGGTTNYVNYLNTGARFNPSTNLWTAMSAVGAPTGRIDMTAIWTGSRLIIWGGRDGISSFWGGITNSGAQYDPQTNSWTPITVVNAPKPRDLAWSVWTGSKMLVWGGRIDGLNNPGGQYDPVSDSWSSITTVGAPSSSDRKASGQNGSAHWTGTEMIVWGGEDSSGVLNNGGLYNPQLNQWRPISLVGGPSARNGMASLWTGSDLIIWGGTTDNYSTTLNDGARYDYASDSWAPLTNLGDVLSPRSAGGVWTGFEIIIWGGRAGSNYFGNGSRFVP